MRAKEFMINVNVPITVSFPAGGGDPIVTTGNDEQESPVDNEPKVMVPPLQQKLELMKANAGKSSDVIDQLTADEDEPFEG